ncbi:hypothetical protein HYW46_05085 [Candidatus Daviesbacteria bacterium]|nr:hypothetical protein [Candidatus Daviesbacteria bacterium]
MGTPTPGLIILILAVSLAAGFFIYQNNTYKTSPTNSPAATFLPQLSNTPLATTSPTPSTTVKPTPTKTNNQNNQGACIDRTKLEVWYSQPFNDKTAQQAESYFQANNLTIVYPPQSNTRYVVQIPNGSSGEYWINKLASEGFGNVNYWRTMGCDPIR